MVNERRIPAVVDNKTYCIQPVVECETGFVTDFVGNDCVAARPSKLTIKDWYKVGMGLHPKTLTRTHSSAHLYTCSSIVGLDITFKMVSYNSFKGSAGGVLLSSTSKHARYVHLQGFQRFASRSSGLSTLKTNCRITITTVCIRTRRSQAHTRCKRKFCRDGGNLEIDGICWPGCQQANTK